MPHVWHGGGFKKKIRRNFFQHGAHFNKMLYHWTANYCDKQVNHCPYTFSSIWPPCFCKVKHTGDNSNGVDRLVQWCRSLRNVRWTGTESQSRFLAFLFKFRHFTLHTFTGRSSKSLTVYTFLKKYQHVHVQHRKITFILECEYPRTRTLKQDLIMQKDRYVVQMIVSQNIFQIIISLENWEEKKKKISSVGSGTQYNYMNVKHSMNTIDSGLDDSSSSSD